MHYMTKLGLYLSALGSLTFMTGMISSSLMGNSSNTYSRYVPSCVMGGIIIFFIGFAMFGYGIFKEEAAKVKNENKK
jgi:hypothetical protein